MSKVELIQGRLYHCPKYYLLVFPTLEKLLEIEPAITWVEKYKMEGAPLTRSAKLQAEIKAEHLSDRHNCKIQVSNIEDIFLYLDNRVTHAKFYSNWLFPKFSGWIHHYDFLEIQQRIAP